jgi:DNA polymerase-3 subunit delta
VAFAPRGGGSGGGAAHEDLARAVARGDIAPVYCLYGAERYLVDRCLAAIRAAVVGGPAAAFASFNSDLFDLREASLVAVVAAARTLPMMAKLRLVVARGIDAVKADDLAPLLGYAEDPSPSTCLVLVGDKIDTRFKVFQTLRKAGWLHDFPSLRDRELPGWIAGEARARGITVASDAAAALAEAAGPELGRLAQALEQLALYAGDRKAITLADVEELVAETRQRSVFELTKAIGSGDAPRALRLLANMFRNREPALRVQYMLARQLRQIWRAKELLAAGESRQDIATAVGVPPFFIDDILVPARRMSARTLARSFERLYRADKALKSSRVDGELLLSRLVEELADDVKGRTKAPAPAPSARPSR